MPPTEHRFFRATRTIRALPALFALAALAGCAGKTSVSSTWHDRAASGAGFDRVLVVAVTENADRRLSFEDSVVEDLRRNNIEAWASERLMGPETEINLENVRVVAQEQDAQAVVVTRVQSLDVEAVEHEGRTDVTQQRKQGAIFRYDYIEKQESTYVTTTYTTSLITDVYPVGDGGDSIYTVSATATKQETLADMIDTLSDVIARKLRSDGVLR